MKRERLSVTVICHNEEDNIGRCLESVKWADEIVVVDSGSTDRTVEISRRYTDKVFINPWPGHKEQKNFAVGQTSCLWVLSVDADEEVSADQRDWILRELESPSFDGCMFPRKNYFLGKWLKHGGWYPDHVLRLFRKDKGSFGGVNPHDQVIIASGRVHTTSLPFTHHTYTSVGQYILKQHIYSTISAGETYFSKKYTRTSGAKILGKALWKFIETYLLKRGFLDGVHGLVAAMGTAVSAFWKQVKIWELERAFDKGTKPPSDLQTGKKLQ